MAAHLHRTDERVSLRWDEVAGVAGRLTARAAAFVETLDPAQRSMALLPLAGEARRDWHYVPRDRPGLALRDMREPQRAAVWALLDTALSAEGSAKARGVLALEAILQSRTADKAFRDPLNYALAIFGLPGPAPWAWRFEGHHISVTLTLVPGVGIGVTPHFLGANPYSGEVVASTTGHGGLARVLERESAVAFELANLLDDTAWNRALIAPAAPPDFLTRPGRELSLRGEPAGLPVGEMPDEGRRRIEALIEAFVGHLDADLARPVLADLRAAGLDRLHFAWAGARTPDELHYWRLHGASLILEYDKTDRDHAHSVWHDPTNLFGDDYLRRHHEASHGG